MNILRIWYNGNIKDSNPFVFCSNRSMRATKFCLFSQQNRMVEALLQNQCPNACCFYYSYSKLFNYLKLKIMKLTHILIVVWYLLILTLAIYAQSEIESPYGATAAFIGIIFGGILIHKYFTLLEY